MPVYDSKNSKDFIGMLITKKLISYNPNENRRLDSFNLATLPETAPTLDCFQVLNYL